MNIKYKIIVPIALGTLLAAGCNKAQPAASNTQPQQTAAAPANSDSQKFSDQPYYGMSYLISGDTLSDDAKKALTGFTMGKQTLANGDVQITLTAQKTEYHDQQYTLHSGDQLYLIEKFLGDDDNEANEDKNMGDDEAVVVDSQGNVVGQPAGWTASGTTTATPPPPTSAAPAPIPAKSFTVNASDDSADLTTITVAKGTPVSITFKPSKTETYHGGLDFRSANLSTGTIAPGGSKTVTFTADQSFTFVPYWPSTNIKKPYTVAVVVQ